MIFVPSYWPFFTSRELRRFDYTDDTGSMPPITSVFSYDEKTDSMRYDDFNERMEWVDTWFYQHRPGVGVAEWRDDYPMPSWLAWLLGPVKRVVMDPPIIWGEFMEIGKTERTFPRMDPFNSLPPQFALGRQEVYIEAILPSFTLRDGTTYQDVIVMFYQQTWNRKTTGARYWMARDVGPIAIEWIAPNPADGNKMVITARIDAKVTSVIIEGE